MEKYENDQARIKEFTSEGSPTFRIKFTRERERERERYYII